MAVMLSHADGLAVVTDDRLEQFARRHRPARQQLPAGTPARVAAEREYSESLRNYRNREGGYWVASNDPNAADRGLTGRLPSEQVRQLAVLSDGASRLVDLFHQATWEDAMNLLATNGPHALLAAVRNAELRDRDGQRWPRGKCHDDASAAFAVPA